MSTTERRKHQRREASFFTVAWRLGEDGEERLPLAGYARDISTGGLFFYTEDSLRLGDRVLLSIYPDSGWKNGEASPKLVARGQVLRVRRVSAPQLPGAMQGVAIKFDRQPEIALEDHDTASLMLLIGRLPKKTFFSRSARRASISA